MQSQRGRVVKKKRSPFLQKKAAFFPSNQRVLLKKLLTHSGKTRNSQPCNFFRQINVYVQVKFFTKQLLLRKFCLREK